MKITGSIVTYNNADIIEKCIDSVLKMSENIDFTLYVVDNGSTDDTCQIIRDKFKSVILIENKDNIGFGSGHNKVILMDGLDSDYHAVINPDIVLAEPAIKELADYLETHGDVCMVTPKVLNDDGSEQYLAKYCPTVRYTIISKFKPFRYLRKRYTRQLENLGAETDIEFCTGCFFVARTGILREVDGFDERFFMYCEDADLSRRIGKIGRIIFYRNVAVTHSWARENTRSLRGIMRFMSSLCKYFGKWGVAL